MSVTDVFLEVVAPSFGVFIAGALFLSPLKTHVAIRANRELGEFNPIPDVFILWNCINWICYSFVLKDYFLFFANIAGIMLGAWYTMITFRFAGPKVQNRMEAILLATTFVTCIVGLASTFAFKDGDEEGPKLLWAITANTVLLIFYSSPLSSMAKVLRERDSSSLHLPLCVMNTVNGTTWVIYGTAIGNYFISVPNGIGAALGLLQIVLCCVLPRKRQAEMKKTGSMAHLKAPISSISSTEQTIKAALSASDSTTTMNAAAYFMEPVVTAPEGTGPGRRTSATVDL